METKRSYVATVEESYFETEATWGGWVRSSPITIGVFDSLSKSEAEAIERQLNRADIPRGPDCQFDIGFTEMSGFEFELAKREFETSQANSTNFGPQVANLVRLCAQANELVAVEQPQVAEQKLETGATQFPEKPNGERPRRLHPEKHKKWILWENAIYEFADGKTLGAGEAWRKYNSKLFERGVESLSQFSDIHKRKRNEDFRKSNATGKIQ